MLTFSSYHTYLEDRLTLLRAACVSEAVIGQQEGGVPACFFMIGGILGKGKGIIPAGPSFGSATPLRMVDLEASVECTSPEMIIAGVLPRELVKPFNRQIDRAIVDALDGCDRLDVLGSNSNAADLVAKGLVALGKNEVPIEDEDNMFVLGGPALRDMIHRQVPSSADKCVTIKPGSRVECKVLRWAGCNWLFSPIVAGAGTSSEQCYVFHRHAIGHALDLAALAAPGGVTGGIDPKTGTGWMKACTKQRAAVLQPSGIVRVVSRT